MATATRKRVSHPVEPVDNDVVDGEVVAGEEDLSGLDEFNRQAELTGSFVQGRQDSFRKDRGVTKSPEKEQKVQARGGKGWGAHKTLKKESTKFADYLQVADEEVVIKFIEPEPFWVYYQHWINELSGQKSFVCLGDDCPLCEIDQPGLICLFNVIDLREDGPALKIWRATPGPADAIAERASSAKTKPINRDDLYFAVSKAKQKNNFYAYSVDPVKARDLGEDYGLNPLTDEHIKKLAEKAYDESIVRLNSRRELQEIVEALQ